MGRATTGAETDGVPSRVPSVLPSVDWLTATSSDPPSRRSLTAFGRHLVSRESILGNPRLPWAFFGYSGTQSGRAAVGDRRDGAICVAQSELAGEVWEQLLEHARHVSRIDLAVTVGTAVRVEGLAEEAFRCFEDFIASRGRPARRSIIKDGKGGQTFYLGSRESDWYGRIYDKQAQSLDERYRNCWRYELEVKGDSADRLARALLATSDRASAIRATVHQHFAKRGVRPIFDASGVNLRDTPKLDRTCASARFAWLSEQVAPTVKMLRNQYGLEMVLRALGIAPELLYNDPGRREPKL